MVGKHDDFGLNENIHITLRGPDGKIKDERVPENNVRKVDIKEEGDEDKE